MNPELRSILDAFAGRRVLVVGDVMLDEFLWGEVRRISPEAPVPVVELRQRTYMPGGAANTAANVAALGGRVSLAGVIGEDYHCEILRRVLAERQVGADGLITGPGRVTTTKSRIVAHSQQLVRLDNERRAPLDAELEERLLRWIEARLSEVDSVVISDYAKGVVSGTLAQRLIAMARSAGRPVVVDPKGTDPLKYRGATLVKPNLHEASRFCGVDIDGDAELLEAGRKLVDLFVDSEVLITRGPHGMSLFRRGAEPVQIRSTARDVFDVTGAGDTVAGTLALALAAGATTRQAALLANLAAGVVVGKVGTTTVTHKELAAVAS
jgi:D-beta-D-heptose 7-phosphate kinase/D-beta-D-heptose 1-phosphate adenosyltransferase